MTEERKPLKGPLKGKKTWFKKTNHRFQDNDQLFMFTLGESPSVEELSFKDYKTLEHDTWLNDPIINFSLAWLHIEVLQGEDRARVYIFSTFFYR